MDRLILWALSNRPLVLAAAALLTVVGAITTARMPVDVFPDLTAPTVTVMTEAPGMAPTEVESLVTFPIETSVNGAPGVRRVRSATGLGLSIVWVEFDWGTVLRDARQIVTEKLAGVAGDLPPEVERPELTPPSSLMGEILYLALTSERHSPTELRTYADTVVRRRLMAVPGVSQVTPIGGAEKQYQVTADPAALATQDVPLRHLLDALQAGNANVSAGILHQGGSEWVVTGLGRMRTLEDIARTSVPTREGVPLRVGDVATVAVGQVPARGEGSSMGRPAVILGIQKQPGANTLDLTRHLDVVFAELASRLPEGMNLRTDVFRQADFIEIAVRNVKRALVEGVVLVTVVILLFLANARATVITLTAIPLSLVTAVLALRQFGASIDTMTLGGMAIAIGALVDDAVIDVENVVRRLRANHTLPPEQRRPSLRVVLDASLEIRGSIVFATLIIALVFLPVFFLGGIEGRLLEPLAIAYLIALLASLLVAVTVTPVLCSFLLPGSPGVQAPHEPRFVRGLKAAYQPLLDVALRRPVWVVLPALIALAIALAILPRLGRAFLPEFNEGSLTLTAVTLPGTSLAESSALGLEVEKALLTFPEVVSVARRTGRAELDEHVQGVESSEIEVSTTPGTRSRAAFLADLRTALARIPGLAITVGQPISHRIDHMLSGTRAAIAVKIFGPDLHTLRTTAEQARAAMAGIPGVVDLSVDAQSEVPQLTVRLDRDAILRHGLSIQETARTLEAAIQGTRVTRILEGQVAYDLVVRLSGPGGWNLDSLGDLPIDTPSGARVPLRTLARIRRETGPNRIQREQVERKIIVQSNVSGRDVTGVVRDIRAVVDPLVAMHPNLRVEYGGQFESAAAAGRTLLLVGAGVILAIGFLLHLAFRSARDAALIMLNLPLALIGGVAGVIVGGGILSVASLIGFISVFGIATRNGIMLVSHIRHLQAHEGVDNLREAVHRGAMERVVPILMTALAAGLALIPLALGGDQPGNEIQTPMALVILFGLLTSMGLNMLVVPALYVRFGKPPRPPGTDITPPTPRSPNPIPNPNPARPAAPTALPGSPATVAAAFLALAFLLSPAAARTRATEPPTPTQPSAPHASKASPTSSASAPSPDDSIASPLTLDQALALAEQHHPGLAEADALVRAAEGRLRQAGTRPAPEALARIEAAPFGGRFARDADVLAGLGLTLPLGNRIARGVDVEAAEQQRATLEGRLRQIEVRRQVQGAFATALYQEHARRLRLDLLDNATHTARIAHARIASGDAVPADLASSDAALTEAQSEAQQSERLLQQALVSLATTLGLAPGSVPGVAGTLDAALELPALHDLSAALTRHPSDAAAQADVTARTAAVAWARTLRVPDLRAEILYRRGGSTGQDGVDLGLSLPLPWPNRSAGRLQEAEALRNAAEARQRATRRQLEGTLAAAHARLANVLADVRFLESAALPAAQTSLRNAEARLAAGDLALADVLPLRRDRARVGLRHLETLRDAMLAWNELRPFLTR